MSRVQDCLKIESFANTSYRKCECCGRPKDIYFRFNVKDADTASMLVGSFELCKDCGQQIGAILGIEASIEHVVKEFTFG